MNIHADKIRDARAKGAYNFELAETYPLGTFEVLAAYPGTGVAWSLGQFESPEEARSALEGAGVEHFLDWTEPRA